MIVEVFKIKMTLFVIKIYNYNDDFKPVYDHIVDKLNNSGKGIVLLHGEKGCLALGTKVLMFDGTYKEVQDVEVGDQLMGPDSTPRNVLSLVRGKQQMYWVRQNRGMDYRVNEDHILSLKKHVITRYKKERTNGVDKLRYDLPPIFEGMKVVENMTVKDFNNLTPFSKNRLTGYISDAITFKKETDPLIDPYFLGLWLGDGTKSTLSITNKDEEVIDYIEKYAIEK